MTFFLEDSILFVDALLLVGCLTLGIASNAPVSKSHCTILTGINN